MNKFENLRQFLTPQKKTPVIDARMKLTIRSVEEARVRAQPLIEGCMETLKEYYETILKPRTDLREVLKKREEYNVDFQRSHNFPFVYSANFISEDLLNGNIIHFGAYADPGRMDFNDWHPNVALQFKLQLGDKYNRREQKVIDLWPNIELNVWGAVEVEKRMIMPANVGFEHLNAFDSVYTGFNINGNINNPKAASDSLSKVLEIITPQVLTHREIMKGKG